MGNHFNSQHYLKGFTETTDSLYIWVYEKKMEGKKIPKCFRSNIKNVAQETHLYSEETENYLTKEIEQPANSVIDKIRGEKFITLEDKGILSNYMAVQMKRVPVARDLIFKWNQDISKIYPEGMESPSGKSVEEQAIWESVLPPEMTPDVSRALRKMKWKFLVYDKEPIFLTSDNPIFFPSSMGIGNLDSEVTFPISTNIALWASWSKEEKEEYVPIDKELAIDINRWSIRVADRHLYFSKQASWITDLITNR